MQTILDLVQDGRFVAFWSIDDNCFTVSIGGSGGGALALAVYLHKLAKLKLGPLDHLNFSDHDIMKGIDALALLLNVFRDGVGDKLIDDLLEVRARNFRGDDLDHSLSDGAYLRGLGVGRLANLVLELASEANDKYTQKIVVRGAHVDLGLNERLPLLDHRA